MKETPWTLLNIILTYIGLGLAFYFNRWDIATFAYVHLIWIDLRVRIREKS